MAEVRFRAPVRPSGRGGGGHLVDVPPEVIEELGGKGRIPVTATFDGVPYRGSIVRMGGGSVLGVQKAIMAEAGVSVGDTLTVVVRNDDAPREVEVPDDLADALARNEPGTRGVRGPLVLAQARVRSFDHRRQTARDKGATHRTHDPGAARAGFRRLGPTDPIASPRASTAGAPSSAAPSRRARPHTRCGGPPRPPSGAPSETLRRAAAVTRSVRTRSRVQATPSRKQTEEWEAGPLDLLDRPLGPVVQRVPVKRGLGERGG